MRFNKIIVLILWDALSVSGAPDPAAHIAQGASNVDGVPMSWRHYIIQIIL